MRMLSEPSTSVVERNIMNQVYEVEEDTLDTVTIELDGEYYNIGSHICKCNTDNT